MTSSIKIFCPHCQSVFSLPFESSSFFNGLTYAGRCDHCNTFVQMSVKVSAPRPEATAEMVLSFLKNQPYGRATIETISYEMGDYNVDTTLIDLARDGFISENDTGTTTLYHLLPSGFNLLSDMETAAAQKNGKEHLINLDNKPYLPAVKNS